MAVDRRWAIIRWTTADDNDSARTPYDRLATLTTSTTDDVTPTNWAVIERRRTGVGSAGTGLQKARVEALGPNTVTAMNNSSTGSRFERRVGRAHYGVPDGDTPAAAPCCGALVTA